MAGQMKAGKAFEYAILREFKGKLEKLTTVKVIDNSPLILAKECFHGFDTQKQGRYLLTASFAVNFLIDIEPRLSNDIDETDILELEILPDSQGEIGDVRDVLAIRAVQKWEIGVSAKNNHKAVKHSRLSPDIDFGKKWLGVNCSSNYFSKVNPIFAKLKDMQKKSDGMRTWGSIDAKSLIVYTPILNAFKDELQRLYDADKERISRQLIEYLVGSKDFYKVIKRKNSVEIQAYNLRGTLNLPFDDIQPKFITPQCSLPTEILDISFKENSETTLIVKLNNNWKLSFRIHNASSLIEPSLKFDINLLKAPSSLFTNTLSVPKEA
ncbi:restriction endonuclease [Methylococcaceae bacterium CS5]|nr:restriction endonuclease [Methylococcaceae bacterium CS4]TXK93751.1 restriction endonuclease [Methylococcaceae bacterium CS5]TXL04213.1 restriction endonuclease [Methylococcaceae bacterium CS2]